MQKYEITPLKDIREKDGTTHPAPRPDTDFLPAFLNGKVEEERRALLEALRKSVIAPSMLAGVVATICWLD